MLQILFAFIGGVLTIAAPCILPVLPILLGTSIGENKKSRPLYIVLGFVSTFALAGLIISILVQHIPFLNQNNIRTIAIFFIAIFGIFLMWPVPFEWLMQKFNGVTNEASQKASSSGSALALGMTLGLVWAPCAGPILAAILALVAAQGNTGHSIILLLAYALGAGVPMLIIAYGSQFVSTKVRAIAQYSRNIQIVFGGLIFLLAIAMFFQYDIAIENKLAGFFPQTNIENKLTGQAQTSNETMQPISFKNYGQAPDFNGISNWINSDPLTKDQLKGKVVLVDFWTYSCINCIRTLPYVTKWYDTYKDQGLVVIGVHTPEFPFEKVTENVQTAVKRFNINYPVAQDNDYGTWKAFNNKYWPAEYLIDQNGTIVYEHFGEGEYDHTENAIRELLKLNASVAPDDGQNLSGVRSPEMYFGTDRLHNLSSSQSPSPNHDTSYTLPGNLPLNNFALQGEWKFYTDHIVLAEGSEGSGKIKLHFQSGKVYMVAASDNPQSLKIFVDGKPQPDVAVSEYKLYPLFDSNDYSEHIIEIEIPQAGFQGFTFTFG
jgi:cytochrome c biogenesis protein CcdA/thiol-disulfide isomerase/thioredoxin